MFKKLSNNIVDLKRNAGEGMSNPRPYKYLFRKKSPYKSIEPTLANLNIKLGEVVSDSYFNYQQEHNLEKDFIKWVNAMNLLANHFLDVYSLTEQPNDYT